MLRAHADPVRGSTGYEIDEPPGKMKVNDIRKSTGRPPSTTPPPDQGAPPTDKRRARHDKKRQAYLDEAMGLVVQDGMEGLTIARLAARMNASVGAVYRYFPSKEALLVGLQEMAIADFHDFMQARIAAASSRLASSSENALALARVMVAFGAYLEHAERSPRAHRLVDAFLSFPEAILSDDEARSVGERLLAPILGAFADLLGEAVAAGALEPGDDAQRTRLAWAYVHGLDHFRKLDRLNPEPLRLKALLPLARTGLLRGFGARVDELAEAERLLDG